MPQTGVASVWHGFPFDFPLAFSYRTEKCDFGKVAESQNMLFYQTKPILI
jgi:hypothetical protein